jgi:hypothetical protein
MDDCLRPAGLGGCGRRHAGNRSRNDFHKIGIWPLSRVKRNTVSALDEARRVSIS